VCERVCVSVSVDKCVVCLDLMRTLNKTCVL